MNPSLSKKCIEISYRCIETQFLFDFLSFVLLKSLSGLSRVDTVRPCADGVSIHEALDKPILAFVSLMKEN